MVAHKLGAVTNEYTCVLGVWLFAGQGVAVGGWGHLGGRVVWVATPCPQITTHLACECTRKQLPPAYERPLARLLTDQNKR